MNFYGYMMSFELGVNMNFMKWWFPLNKMKQKIKSLIKMSRAFFFFAKIIEMEKVNFLGWKVKSSQVDMGIHYSCSTGKKRGWIVDFSNMFLYK